MFRYRPIEYAAFFAVIALCLLFMWSALGLALGLGNRGNAFMLWSGIVAGIMLVGALYPVRSLVHSC